MNFDVFYKNLGKQIKTLREAKGYTLELLAEKSSLSLDYIGKIEVNINKPGLKSLLKISKALNVSMRELFDFDCIF